jgi:hypothetical protein
MGGGGLGLAALGPLPPALFRLLASVPQQQVPLHLAPRTGSEQAVGALEVRDLLDLLVDSAMLPLHLGPRPLGVASPRVQHPSLRRWGLRPVLLELLLQGLHTAKLLSHDCIDSDFMIG